MVVSGFMSRASKVITHMRGLITGLITTLNPKPEILNPAEPLK